MNNLQYGYEAQVVPSIDRVPGNISITPSTEGAYGLPKNGQHLSEEDKGYRDTCAESYDITQQMLSLYALYPDSLYAI